MTDEIQVLQSEDDVTIQVLKSVEDCFDAYAGERFTNDEFIDELADTYGLASTPKWDIESYDNPAVRKILRHVRHLRKETAER